MGDYSKAPGVSGPVYEYGNGLTAGVFLTGTGLVQWVVWKPDGTELASGGAGDEMVAWQECNTIIGGYEA